MTLSHVFRSIDSLKLKCYNCVCVCMCSDIIPKYIYMYTLHIPVLIIIMTSAIPLCPVTLCMLPAYMPPYIYIYTGVMKFDCFPE